MLFYAILSYFMLFYAILCYFMLALGGDPRTPLEFSEYNIDFSYIINRRFSNRNPIGFGQTCGGVLLILCYFMLFYAILCYSVLFSMLFDAILSYFVLFYAILCYFVLFYAILYNLMLFYAILCYS